MSLDLCTFEALTPQFSQVICLTLQGEGSVFDTQDC